MFVNQLLPLPLWLYHKSVHGSTSSPRTDQGALEIDCLAVRPELVEGRAADYDTVSQGGGNYIVNFHASGLPIETLVQAGLPSGRGVLV